MLVLVLANIAVPNCTSRCGNISIPYPFGITSGCHREGFKLACNETYHPPKLFMDSSGVEVLEISSPNSTLYIDSGILTLAGDESDDGHIRMNCIDMHSESNRFPIKYTIDKENLPPVNASLALVESKWWSKMKNVMMLQKAASSDTSLGASKGVLHPIPGVPIRTAIRWMFSNLSCAAASNSSDFGCLSDRSECLEYPISDDSTGGYTCRCWHGYHGNPYVQHGCQDIDECTSQGEYPCFGQCINLIGSYTCTCPHGTTGDPRKQNGCSSTKGIFSGFTTVVGIGSCVGTLLIILRLLLQRLVDKDIAERMLFSLQELEKATNKFDEARKLGGGGHGTVYKGILSDKHVVAIKKSKVVIQRETDDFINEIAILSQVNHRNVVKLFGCCLETEVPLLVYEFISNGTLSDHLHVGTPLSMPWKDRLRIAIETSRCLSYLHSAAYSSCE
ncbi:wall-associated receptor kinase 5-like [Aegilops tauschii subsp. strangulata]|uniref:wall-associated receptor kinase 5-like n=1 Tax=Aegilops tauschii subsp. strangulata TaxID=200361 RepID=UPI00098A9D7C|nr:putative wall-associated receptor kinase-like 11 [Aegilops tauschii subsp. strangulata]